MYDYRLLMVKARLDDIERTARHHAERPRIPEGARLSRWPRRRLQP
jgi:hypothetical protein